MRLRRNSLKVWSCSFVPFITVKCNQPSTVLLSVLLNCIYHLYFSTVILNCISQMYFSTVFLNCISQLYFQLCPIHHCEVQRASLSNAQLPLFTVASWMDYNYVPPICGEWVIPYEKVNITLFQLSSVGYVLSMFLPRFSKGSVYDLSKLWSSFCRCSVFDSVCISSI